MTATQRLRRSLGAILLGGVGGAMLGALLGLIVSDVLSWWDRGVVIIAVVSLGSLAGIVASTLGESADSVEDDA
jgi:hypothetical protein